MITLSTPTLTPTAQTEESLVPKQVPGHSPFMNTMLKLLLS